MRKWKYLLLLTICLATFIAGCSNPKQVSHAKKKESNHNSNQKKEIKQTAPIQDNNKKTSEQSFNTIFMMSDRSGWASTDKGILYMENDSWKNVSPPLQDYKQNPSSLYAYNNNVAFVKIDNIVFNTIDSGQTWRKTMISPSKDGEKLLNATFSFINTTNGWMLVHNGYATGHSPFDIFRTTDQGETWTLIHHVKYGSTGGKNSIPDTKNPDAITFIDSKLGFITGRGNDMNETVFYKTVNSGETWEPVNLDIPKKYLGNLFEFQTPRFFSNNKGILPVVIRGSQGDTTLFYTTNDQGRSWGLHSNMNGAGPVYFVNSSKGYANIRPSFNQKNSSVFITKDGGESWSKTADLDFAILNLTFTSPLVGWGINEQNQQIVKTEDGGVSWK